MASNSAAVSAIVDQMIINSQSWNSSNTEERERLAQENEALAQRLWTEYGIHANKVDGSWYLPDGNRLYEEYRSKGNGGLSPEDKAAVDTWVAKMKKNSREYLTATEERRAQLAAENERIVNEELLPHGVVATKTEAGVWILADGTKLYDIFATNVSVLDPSVNGVRVSSLDENMSDYATQWGGSSKNSSIQYARNWGILPGYSWDIPGSPDGGLAPDSWRRSSEYARSWMNDGIPSSDAQTRRLIYWEKFDRFYTIDLDRENPSGRHYIFILRPDLYLIDPGTVTDKMVQLSRDSRVANDPYFVYLARMHPEIIASLTGDFGGLGSAFLSNTQYNAATGSGYGNSRTSDGTSLNGVQLTIHSFIPYLTSRIESLQLPDYTVKSNSITQPYTKYTIPYTQSAIESSTGGTFDITFREDKDYSLHKLFYAWVYYENNVMRNIFKPKDKYIKYNAIDYATSVYDFLVDDTGENILYWAKYTGCVPTSVPLSDLGFNKGGSAETKITIGFNYFYCEHMDFNILRDFQYNSLGYIYMNMLKGNSRFSQFVPCKLSDTEDMFNAADRLGPNLTGRPVIIFAKGQGGERVIKLRWLKDNLTTKSIGRAAS